ncbi:TPA: transposase [Clostridioides difficile]|nr:transposase [Clostridioides difficile]HBF4060606.1 transposase [Clostridioides difficile]
MYVKTRYYTNLLYYLCYGDNYQFKLPLNIDYIIPKDDSVRLLSQIIEEMNLEKLYKAYSRIRGNGVTPRQLLKIIIYTNMNYIYSSRKIEQACKRDINFMYLLGRVSAPEYSTIARFRSIHFLQVSKNLLAQFANFIGNNKEISKDALFIDGAKIELSSNRYTFILKKFIEKLNNYIDRLKKYTKDLCIMGERNSYSKTDNDATFMRMKEDHMENGQLKPAYRI